MEMKDVSGEVERTVGYAGAVLISRVNRVIRAAKRLESAKEQFLEILGEQNNDNKQ